MNAQRPDKRPAQPEQPEQPERRVEFLERGSYRQRRFRDAARMLPLFAAVMMFLPLMWPPDDSRTSVGVIYLFGLWVGVIVVAFVLSRLLTFTDTDTDAPPDNRSERPEP